MRNSPGFSRQQLKTRCQLNTQTLTMPICPWWARSEMRLTGICVIWIHSLYPHLSWGYCPIYLHFRHYFDFCHHLTLIFSSMFLRLRQTHTMVLIVTGLPCLSPSHLSPVTVLKVSRRTGREKCICLNMEWRCWEEEIYQEPYGMKFSLYFTPTGGIKR